MAGRKDSLRAYVQAVQDLRRGSRSRPFGSLRGRNRQNKRRAAVRQDVRDSQ